LKNQVHKRWEIKLRKDLVQYSFDPELAISPLMAHILHNRGIMDSKEARTFLHPVLSDLPDPLEMKDMDKAVLRIGKAIRAKEKIMIFGDYDVDGTSATALLLFFLRGLGSQVDYHIPNRLKEGYGLSIEALKKAKASGSSLFITTDCGISNHKEVFWAQENGIDVIITDHHEVPEKLPCALAVLNPKQKNCPYPFKELAGVGVAFNLIIALRTALRQDGFFQGKEEPNLKEYLDLVALGTVSDIVPLTGVNRILTRYGLQQIAQSTRPGILALRKIAEIPEDAVDTIMISFRLAPRINAAGRLGDAREVVDLFTTTDEKEAQTIASHLDEMNSRRQRIEEKIHLDAKGMIDFTEGKKSLVLASPEWHPGVIGIVASRLTEEFQRPTILISLGDHLGKGSGRSFHPFSLYQGLAACQSWLEEFGGHEQAAGLVIRPECIPEFAKAFEEIVSARLAGEDLIPRLSIDALTRLEEVDESFMAELDSLSPFGAGNPEPILGIEGLKVLDSRLVGRGHLRLRIQEGCLTREAIGFRMGSWHPLSGERMRLAFSPQINTFQGRRNLQLKIVDLQKMDS
jgi:single-stranded-DNA-specific exonuclease